MNMPVCLTRLHFPKQLRREKNKKQNFVCIFTKNAD